MPEPLTAEHFNETMRALRVDLDAIQKTQAEHTTRFDKLDTLLWQGQRLEQMAQRIFDIATATGHPELAAPFIASPGMAEPAKS